MTTYAWPDTRGFAPQHAELRVIDNLQRVLESPLSGYVQTQSMPGARWGWAYDMPAHSEADRQALEGYLLRLSGREHRVQLWDHKRARPRGNIALAGVTLGATAAQFATSLTLAGCRSSGSLLLGGSMEADSDLDGLADGIAVYSTGAVGTITTSLVAGPMIAGAFGSTYQRVQASTLTGRLGIYPARADVTAGQVYAMTADVSATSSATVEIYLQFFSAADALLGETVAVFPPGLARRGVSATAPAGSATAQVYVLCENLTGVATLIDIDNIQISVGSALADFMGPATLLAGDWLGLTGGQLVRVVADAAADDAGAMTVEVRHMLRAEVASASAVTLDKPTALYVRTESGLSLPRQAGNAEPGMGLEFVEVFA